jgi:polyphosphate glucokinase
LKVLVVDIGGTNIKIATAELGPVKAPSGSALTPADLVKAVHALTESWEYDRVSIGYPGPVVEGKIVSEPHNLGEGWVEFDFEKAFARPVKVVNDAVLQAVGSYRGGRMLFLGLGTGLGSALVLNGSVEPMELGHLPYKKGRTYEDYLGKAGLELRGKKKWRKAVADVTERLRAALQVEDVVLGGGNAKLLKELPPGARLGSNANAITGGVELWKSAPSVAQPDAPRVTVSEDAGEPQAAASGRDPA